YFFTGVLLLVSLFVAISSLEFMKGDVNAAPYFGLLLLSTLGMIVLAASMDLILLYVGWELMSIPTYALTAIKKRDPNSNEAAVSALLAAGAKMAAFAAAFRVFIVAFGTVNIDWYSTFAIVAIATMTLGNVAALMQKSFTRLLAYSSIAQAGYVMIALAAPIT